jgi:hypothetical protein
LPAFTGIDDPYDAPLNPELTLDTVAHTPEANARLILDYLIQAGLVRPQLPLMEAQPAPAAGTTPAKAVAVAR